MAAIGLLFAVLGAISGASGIVTFQAGTSNLDPSMAALLYVVTGLVIVIVGGLNIFAGLKVKNYRGKTLAIVALAAGLLTSVTCWCAPTALGLLIYGLIVLMNEDVKRAFEMGEQGYSPQDIQRNYYGF